jgi:hypothetical protein
MSLACSTESGWIRRAEGARNGSLYERATFTYVANRPGELNSAPMWLSTCVGLRPMRVGAVDLRAKLALDLVQSSPA